MKKSTARLLVIAVIVMIVLNGVLVSLLWTKQSPGIRQERPPLSEVNEFIIREMGFDDDTAKKFREIALRHYENQRRHQMRYREIKGQLNIASLNQDREEVERLLNDLALVVKEKEMELYLFFSQVMNIANEDQQRSFGRIFREATGAPEYERVPMGDNPNRPPRPRH